MRRIFVIGLASIGGFLGLYSALVLALNRTANATSLKLCWNTSDPRVWCHAAHGKQLDACADFLTARVRDCFEATTYWSDIVFDVNLMIISALAIIVGFLATRRNPVGPT